ncbi:MAG: hypothetical protein EHM45_09945 [Desulfobacteraceae bacterium]|nr:MAG: hypothetical protein EHM45_09945 [Desulfobacteraceae bacterium]
MKTRTELEREKLFQWAKLNDPGARAEAAHGFRKYLEDELTVDALLKLLIDGNREVSMEAKNSLLLMPAPNAVVWRRVAEGLTSPVEHVEEHSYLLLENWREPLPVPVEEFLRFARRSDRGRTLAKYKLSLSDLLEAMTERPAFEAVEFIFELIGESVTTAQELTAVEERLQEFSKEPLKENETQVVRKLSARLHDLRKKWDRQGRANRKVYKSAAAVEYYEEFYRNLLDDDYDSMADYIYMFSVGDWAILYANFDALPDDLQDSVLSLMANGPARSLPILCRILQYNPRLRHEAAIAIEQIARSFGNEIALTRAELDIIQSELGKLSPELNEIMTRVIEWKPGRR